jgi:hypothetical protein
MPTHKQWIGGFNMLGSNRQDPYSMIHPFRDTCPCLFITFRVCLDVKRKLKERKLKEGMLKERKLKENW